MKYANCLLGFILSISFHSAVAQERTIAASAGFSWRSEPKASGGYMPGSRNGILEGPFLSGFGLSVGAEASNLPLKGLSLEGGIVTRVDLFDDFINGDGANTVFVDLYAGILKPIRIHRLTEKKPVSIGFGWYLLNTGKKVTFTAYDVVNMVQVEQKLSVQTSSVFLKLRAPVWKLQVEYSRLWSYGYYFFDDPGGNFHPYFHSLSIKYLMPVHPKQ